MIESHWLFIRVVNRVQSTNLHDWLFGWLIIQQWFDNDCLINQLAWLIIWQWLSHWLFVINQPTHQNWLFIRVVNRVQSTNSHEWLCDNDYSTEFNQPARVIDYSTMIESHCNQLIKLIFHSSSQSSSNNQPTWLIIRAIDHSTMIQQWLIHWLVYILCSTFTDLGINN